MQLCKIFWSLPRFIVENAVEGLQELLKYNKNVILLSFKVNMYVAFSLDKVASQSDIFNGKYWQQLNRELTSSLSESK